MNNDIAIKVENISKVFPLRQARKDENGSLVHEHWALKDISFEIKKGESVGIIGPNGSGKSTLLKILAGVIKPTSGKITIQGKVASILDIGAGFHPELSGRENVFLNGQIHGFSKKEIEAKFDEIVAFSGIEKFIDEPVKNYSNGMYLRLAFSIMAHLDFDVYLFDEVMSVGDAEFREKIQRKIETLTNSDKTILHVSHNTKELNYYSLFLEIEYGWLKNFSKDSVLIENYLEKSIHKADQIVYNSTVELIDIHQDEFIDKILVKKVKFYQKESKEFKSNQDFIFELEIEKLNEHTELFTFLSIGDLQGNIILTTTPILKKKKGFTETGKHNLKCRIPENLFGVQIYRLSLIFLDSSSSDFQLNSEAIFNDNTMETLTQTVFRLENLFTFRVNFMLDNQNIITNSVKNWGGLLPDFEWKYQ